MSVRVRLFADIREEVGETEVEVEGETVGEALESLVGRYPSLEGRLFDGDDVRPHVSLAADGEPAAVSDSTGEVDEIAVYPPVSGGRC